MKTPRITREQSDWLKDTSAESGLSESEIIRRLIDVAITTGWRPVVRVDRGGWINGPGVTP